MMDAKKLKNFNYIYKKLLPIREIDNASKKKIKLISKSFEGTNANSLIVKIYYEQLSYFFKLYFRNDFKETMDIYKEKKKTGIERNIKQFNYLVYKIHHYIQLCEGNITLVNTNKSFKIHIRNRIHSLLFQYTQDFEDFFFLYYSQAFKKFSFFYQNRLNKEKYMKENVDKNYRLTEKERIIVTIPEFHNITVSIDDWDSSGFYKEYIEKLEEENDDNFSDMLYEEENDTNEDSFIENNENETLLKKQKADQHINEDVEMNTDDDSESTNDEKSNHEDQNNEMNYELETTSNSDGEISNSGSTSHSSDDSNDNYGDFDEEYEKEQESKIILNEDYDSDLNDDNYDINYNEPYMEKARKLIKQFAINSSYIISDHLLYRYESIVSNVIYRHIRAIIFKKHKGVFNQPCLVKSIEWYKRAIIPFQNIIYLPNFYPENQKSFISWNARIRYFIYKTYFDLRTSELFDIIVDYPESKWSLIDLKISIKKTGLIKELISSLNESIQRRLLHQGAKTSDIVHQYISLIRCMQILDPSGLLLDHVSGSIKKYLREREDTIKCIVQILVDDNNSELFESIPKQDIVAFDEMNLDNYNNDNWMPELLEIDPANETVKKKSVDIVSTLLNIYDSKDMLIKEFQELLASRLLALKSYDLSRELRNLELLKLRLGENNLQLCEVMIKDISSSRRIDYNVHTETNDDEKPNNSSSSKTTDKKEIMNNTLPLHAKILSHLFWPPFKPTNLKFPKEIQKYADIYSKKYTALKPSRKLQWLPYLGNVSLTVELEDRTLTFNDLTPIQAIILYNFQEKDQWKLNELSNKLEITSVVVKKAISFWISKGVMKEISKDVFKILEKEEEISNENEENQTTIEETEEINTENDNKEQETEKMRIYWTFISNMITNLGGMTIERIHQMLQVCLPAYKNEMEQLGAFLEVMVQENKLELNGDIYVIKK